MTDRPDFTLLVRLRAAVAWAVLARYGARPGSTATTHFTLDVFGYYK